MLRRHAEAAQHGKDTLYRSGLKRMLEKDEVPLDVFFLLSSQAILAEDRCRASIDDLGVASDENLKRITSCSAVITEGEESGQEIEKERDALWSGGVNVRSGEADVRCEPTQGRSVRWQ